MANTDKGIKNETVAALLKENRIFTAPAVFKENAHCADPAIYAQAGENTPQFWAKEAQNLDWFKPWDETLKWEPPFAQWFVGGKINVSYNCLDRHIKNGLGDKTAFFWEGEDGTERVLSFQEMYTEVNKFANVLKSLGLVKGDRVAIYMPMVPEAVIAMQACARIGAVHTVVFGGFSPESLADRINDSQVKVLITADGGYRRGKIIELKKASDEALKSTPSIEHVIVYNRCNSSIEMQSGRDHWYHDLMDAAEDFCAPEPMDAEDMLFILYTSGTTGKPKGIMHTTGGYLTGVTTTTKWVFDIKDKDVFWCTADVGWITGHSYLAYGPMANAATQVMYEGSPDYPQRHRLWQIVEKYKVTIFYTAPTAIRAFMKWGEAHPAKCDLSSLRLLGTVGEPINPEAWVWYYKFIGHESCPIVDTWWQTETGSIMISALPAITDQKPGSATKPLPGIDAAILNEEGTPVDNGGGYLALRKPWPSMLRGIYGDSERYKDTYWSKWKDVYFPGDGAKIDEDGYFWLLGRVDDVMNVSGHRIGTMEVESALVDHPSVAESAVVAITDEIKGQAIAAFVILKEGQNADDRQQKILKEHVAKKIGAIARPEKIIFTADLPKTRSGKIMRRLLRDIGEGDVLGDVTTLADPAIVEALKNKYESKES